MVGSRRVGQLGAEVVSLVGRALGDGSGPLVVALSGGADSAVLAWALRECGWRHRAVHVHHGWPGSDRMQSAARAVADRLGLELVVVAVDTSRSGSPEAVAREARYQALERGLGTGERIVTGHTLDDQAETVLGNLLWGSGLDGLRGIHRHRPALVRPLLDVTRTQIRELAALLGLPFADDPANQDASYRRVRIRRALAGWERTLAPGIGRRLADLARLVETDLAFLDRASAAGRVESLGGSVRVAAGEIRTLPAALAARVVRRALRTIGEGYPGVRRDVDVVLRAAVDGTEGRVSGGHPVARVGAYVVIGAGDRPAGPPPTPLSVPGATRWGAWNWEAREHPGRPEVFPLSRWRQVFDARSLPRSGAMVRPAGGDDRIAMARGGKRVADALSEARIPTAERPGWPVLAVGGEVLWVPGVRRAYRGWVDEDTMGYVEVEATREGRWKPVGS